MTGRPASARSKNVLLALAVVAAVGLLVWILVFMPAPVELVLPVQGVSAELAAKLEAIRAARLGGFEPGPQEDALAAAWSAFNELEAVVVSAPPKPDETRTERLAADPELQELRAAVEGAIKRYVADVGAPRYLVYGTWKAVEFEAALSRLMASVGGPPAEVSGTATAAATAPASAETRLARTAADPAAGIAPVCGGFPVLFVERGLLDLRTDFDASHRELAIALFEWRWMLGLGRGAPSYLEPEERLAYWKAVAEIEPRDDPAARLPRRLGALNEIARLDPTYPVALTRGVLLARAGLLGEAEAALREATTAAPTDPRAEEYLEAVRNALGDAAGSAGGSATATAAAAGTAAATGTASVTAAAAATAAY